jgi:uncharacterized Zn-binding protein involved in type VI secretion
MPAAARKDDAIACGSKINAGSGDVNINGKPAARFGDAGIEAGFSAHTIKEGSGTVFINGKKAARVGDKVTTHTKSPPTHTEPAISAGSGNVNIG